MLNFNPEGKKVILSIDGGGMRGAITIAMLAELETMTGETCQELFDMCAGTSTGAIIAAALSIGMSAQEILKVIYKDKLPNAFQPQGVLFWLRYLFGGLRYLYPLEPFVKVLGPLVAGKKVRDAQHPIVLFTTKDVRTSNTYFIVSKGPGAAAFADWPLLGAVAASSAAPVFFPPVADNLIDGGVGSYGNPCLGATIEAMEYIGASEGFVDDHVIHISLGTGYPPNRIAGGKAAKFWLADWIQYIIGESLDDAGLQQTFVTRKLYKDRIDFRRYNPLLTIKSVSGELGIRTEGRPDPVGLGLDSHQPEEVNLMEEIGRVYARKIDWTKPGLMPWDTVGGHAKPEVDQAPVDWSQTIYGI